VLNVRRTPDVRARPPSPEEISALIADLTRNEEELVMAIVEHTRAHQPTLMRRVGRAVQFFKLYRKNYQMFRESVLASAAAEAKDGVGVEREQDRTRLRVLGDA
jgi:hypothetical protein